MGGSTSTTESSPATFDFDVSFLIVSGNSLEDSIFNGSFNTSRGGSGEGLGFGARGIMSLALSIGGAVSRGVSGGFENVLRTINSPLCSKIERMNHAHIFVRRTIVLDRLCASGIDMSW
ncbi:hypothetical protein [Glaciecola sp. HTCC2999]|uniref:hypothetical protein n=1 Tax=Glaciecola sp. HTCC2999 TaxID=455436 RepID=UPI0000E0EE8D|nr:hypothetical protein [Glaciecola sp. HTCC2999]